MVLKIMRFDFFFQSAKSSKVQSLFDVTLCKQHPFIHVNSLFVSRIFQQFYFSHNLPSISKNLELDNIT